jgi:glutamate N-acetyltransferase/amino-acid N-acetyltransferase
VIIMASGEAGNAPIATEAEDYAIFEKALESLCINLARKMARDGEGATKLITVNLTGAKDETTAETLARSVASSSLVKAAIFGADANWGRVLCALGYSGAEFNPGEAEISFAGLNGEVKVCSGGAFNPFSEADAKKILSEEEIEIRISVGKGLGEARVWGCDLTYDYVKINGDYRS